MKKRPPRIFHYTLSKERIVSKTFNSEQQLNEGGLIQQLKEAQHPLMLVQLQACFVLITNIKKAINDQESITTKRGI